MVFVRVVVLVRKMGPDCQAPLLLLFYYIKCEDWERFDDLGRAGGRG